MKSSSARAQRKIPENRTHSISRKSWTFPLDIIRTGKKTINTPISAAQRGRGKI
jgi:hypothetical protein